MKSSITLHKAGRICLSLWRKIDQRKLKVDILASGFFDEDWYFKTYPDVKQSGWKALNHFCRHGLRELRSPGPFFAPRYYLKSNLDVKQAGISPFLHFLQSGNREGRNPHPLFNVDYYRDQAGDQLSESDNALSHYRNGGWREGLRPNRWFDDATYLDLNPAAKTAAYAPLEHYLRTSRDHKADLSPYFAQDYYCDQNTGALCNWNYTPLHHFVEHGLPEGKLPKPPGLWKPLAENIEVLEERKREILAGYRVKPAAPTVSVVIPAYNQFAYTLHCIASILKADDETSAEIILADDRSTDETEAFFSTVPGLTYIRNPENLGFLKSCNNAARSARGEYLFFLNNDTRVQPGWLDRLVETFDRQKDAGIVGSKLIYPDDTLQESGGYIWQDGTGANIGRGGDETHPAFNFLRSVNYVSGAALMIRRTLWEELGGFDELYAPAYCEDADLCMAVAARDLKIYVQPHSVIVHFEGISSGKSTEGGVKSYQIENQKKLKQKWATELQHHKPSQPVEPWSVARIDKPAVLLIDGFVPSPDRDAGSLVAYHYIEIFLSMGYHVAILPDDLRLFHRYGRALQAIGVEVLHEPHVESGFDYLADHGDKFDLFLLNKVHAGGRYFDHIKKHFPQTPVLFNTADLHFVREQREAMIKGSDPKTLATAARTKKDELRLIRKADQTIIVSKAEIDILAREGITERLNLIPLVMASRAPKTSFETRRGIGFVGGYQHRPNVDAVLFFVAEIWPEIHAQIPDLTFHIAGSNAPDDIRKIDVPGVIYEGFIKDLDGFFDSLIASVAPLRYGAGIKGKIGSSLAAGLPCIASPLAVEGMGLQDGENVIVAKDANDYIVAIKQLQEKPETWKEISKNGQVFIDQTFSPDIISQQMSVLLEKLNPLSLSR